MKYRNLKIGEIIQERDQVQIGSHWENIVPASWGKDVPIALFYRRPLTPEQVANLFREKLAGLMEECGVNGIYLDKTTGRIELDFEGGFLDLWEGYEITPKSLRESITSPETGATE